MMQISRNGELPISDDFEQIAALLRPDGSRLIELGCGTALTTRRLAEAFPSCRIEAFEVDRVQHAKNLEIDDLPNVRFRLGGAEAIDLPDATVDAVLMLKSLHHVPIDAMDRAMAEIRRVLRPGGLAYLSEPVYAGAFNEILRLFNDEERVRKAAFETIRRAVQRGDFQLRREIHFLTLSRYHGFDEFEERVMGATHSAYVIDRALHARIRAAFLAHVRDEGFAEFLSPLRVDLLSRPD
jgi:SAM-dependent methyltransferase